MAVSAWRDQPRIFRKFYYSLMKAYFTFQPNPRAIKPASVDEGCRQLRDFLSTTLETCLLVEPVSDWALTLREFPALLEDQPQRAFADIVLTGDKETLRVVCEKLCLTGDTWLATEAIRTAAAAVMAGQDAFFIENIAVLLRVFDEPRFALLRDEVLAKLLERYAATHDRPVHVALRDFAVNAWKNPWLQANAPGWRRVSTDVRKMVASWLMLDLISQFFLLLSEDGKNDGRRFEFWRRYLDQIGDIYFVIGRRTQETRANEVLALREKLGARVLELAGGEPANNAFIMTIGESMVVEFSKNQNAAYIYSKESFCQKLSGIASIDIYELKSGRTRLIHRDNSDQHWEDRFISQLGEMRGGGVWPDDSPKIPPSKEPSPKPIPQKAQLSAMFDEEEFHRFVAKFALRYEDLRPENGGLRVITNKSSRDALAQLKKWGFTYKPGKGWWKASDRRPI
jgi:hypothetical protein